MLLVRECSQENRNVGFLSDDVLWSCLCEFFGADLRGSALQWSPWWDSPGLWDNVGCHTGVQCMHGAWSSVQPPLAPLSFCPQSLNGGQKFFNHLGYCCGLGWLLNPVVTTRSLVTVCVHWVCLASKAYLLPTDSIFAQAVFIPIEMLFFPPSLN